MGKIAIIPAKGGSKRIPKKNIRFFFGKPIIAYSIETALKSGLFDEVMVSTDNQEIADIAIEYGAKVPFFRSEKNSDDYAITADVMEEVLLEYKKRGKEYEYFCCLYPAAPLVTVEKLKKAMELLEKSGADSVLSVTPFVHPIQRGFKIEEDHTIKMFWPENMNTRSQDLLPTYYDCGQFYCLDVKKFLTLKKLFTDNTLPVIISEMEAQDIDNLDDWKMAELKYELRNKIN